jgi:hypothetical protein
MLHDGMVVCLLVYVMLVALIMEMEGGCWVRSLVLRDGHLLRYGCHSRKWSERGGWVVWRAHDAPCNRLLLAGAEASKAHHLRHFDVLGSRLLNHLDAFLFLYCLLLCLLCLTSRTLLVADLCQPLVEIELLCRGSRFGLLPQKGYSCLDLGKRGTRNFGRLANGSQIWDSKLVGFL